MATITTRKGKKRTTYKADVNLKGYPRMSQSFDRKSEAIRWGEDVEYALVNNLPLPGEDLPQDDKYISDAVDDYLLLMRQDATRSKHTKTTDEGTGKRLITAFGRMSMRSLVREDIEAYKAARLRVVGPASVRHDMSMLSRIYETARVEWRMKDLPYPGQDVKLPPQPRERRAIVPEHKFAVLLEECRRSKNHMLHPLVYLLLNTGMRPEEAVLMRWWQVLWDEAILDLTKTKTDDPRRVPLNAGCIDVLESVPRQEKTDLVFVTEETARKDKPVRFFRRAFEQACIRAGINAPLKRDGRPGTHGNSTSNNARVTLYTLRHSAASYMVMNGVDLTTVRDLLGHSNISQTSRYTHITDHHKKRAVDNPDLPWNK